MWNKEKAKKKRMVKKYRRGSENSLKNALNKQFKSLKKRQSETLSTHIRKVAQAFTVNNIAKKTKKCPYIEKKVLPVFKKICKTQTLLLKKISDISNNAIF